MSEKLYAKERKVGEFLLLREENEGDLDEYVL